MLPLAGRQDDPVVAVGGQADDLEPAVGVARRTAAIHRASSAHPCRGWISPATTCVAPVATSTSAIWAVSRSSARRRAMTARRVPSGDHWRSSTSMPGSREDRRLRRLGAVGGPAAARDRGVDEPDLRPAAPSRQEGEAPAVGRPASVLAPPGLATTRVLREPSASTTHSSSSRTYASRRPSGDHCGSPTGFDEAVSWVGAPPRSGIVNSWRAPADIGRVGDDPVPRVDAELAVAGRRR